MRILAAAAAVFISATSLAAQQARLTGTVRDTTGAPLAGVEVSVQGISRTATTDRQGAFALGGIPTGTSTVTVRRVGFAPQTTIMKFVDGDNTLGVVVLTRIAQELDTVTTREQELWREYPLLREFAENKKIGLGQFVTRQQLEMFRGGFMTPVFNQMRGLQIIRSQQVASHQWIANTYVPNSNCTVLEDLADGERIMPPGEVGCGGVPRYCYPTVFLDNARMAPLGLAANIGAFNPDMFEAIQVYLGAAETPAKYADMRSGCGVIVFHRRVPDKKPRIIAARQDHPTRSRLFVNAAVATSKSGGDCTDCGTGLGGDFRLGYTIRDRWVLAARVANWSGNPDGFQSIKLRQALLEWYPHADPGRYKWFINMGGGTMDADLFRQPSTEINDRYFGKGLPAMVAGTGVDINLVQRLVLTPFISYNRNIGGRSDHTHCVTHFPTATPVTECNTIPSQPHLFTLLQAGLRFGWR
jgi:hypothetical protein